jgi:hypothetical protein
MRRRRMIGKRGDIELQFNWIFVFIVGALIIALAVGFVTTQKKNSDILISSQIIRFTRSVITISSATPGKAEPQPLQKEIGLSCDPKSCTNQGCASDLYVRPRSLNAKIDTKVEAIYGPAIIQGQNLGTWSMEWDMPYHVNNFMYLTSDKVRYVFVKTGDEAKDSLADELYLDMPDIMGQKERVTRLDELKSKNNYKVRLVFVDAAPTIPPGLAAMQNADLSAINIIPETGKGFAIGEVKFYQKSAGGFTEQKGTSDKAFYLGKPTVYGAVFSDTRDIYACNLRKSVTRLEVVSDLYQRKLDKLKDAASGTSISCRTIYDLAYEPITRLTGASDRTPAELLDYSAKIASANNALKLKSCPLIY